MAAPGLALAAQSGLARWRADAFSRFDLVDRLRLGFVEDFQGSMTHIQDERLATIVVPDGGWLDPKAVTVELDQTFIVASGEGNA